MAFAFVNSGVMVGTSGGTTAAINMSGVTLLVFATVQYLPETEATVSDNQSNTYTSLTEATVGTVMKFKFRYKANPVVSSSMTFTASGAGLTAIVYGFSGGAAAPFDAENWGAGASSTISTDSFAGLVTPTEANELILTACCNYGTTAPTIAGFSTPTYQPYIVGETFMLSMAYLIQTTATAVNPAWRIDGLEWIAGVSCFKASAGGGGGTTAPGYHAPFGWT